MITICNRKELLATFSAAKQARVRQALREQGIPHRAKTVGDNGRGNGMGRDGLGITGEYSCEYLIYVHKRDYEKAMAAVGKER